MSVFCSLSSSAIYATLYTEKLLIHLKLVHVWNTIVIRCMFDDCLMFDQKSFQAWHGVLKLMYVMHME